MGLYPPAVQIRALRRAAGGAVQIIAEEWDLDMVELISDAIRIVGPKAVPRFK